MGEGKLILENRNSALSILAQWEEIEFTDEIVLKKYEAGLRDHILFSIIDTMTTEEGVTFLDNHPLAKAMFCDYMLKRGMFTKTFQEKLRKKKEAEANGHA